MERMKNISKPKKPICGRCGGELFIYTEEVHKLYRKINMDGKKSKRVTDINDGDNNIYDRLRCNDCGMEFWFDEDKDGRIIIGDVFNP